MFGRPEETGGRRDLVTMYLLIAVTGILAAVLAAVLT
jgi:hypothetical protein